MRSDEIGPMAETGKYPRDAMTGVILAGGRARRMGGEDKGLVTLNGLPMVHYVVRSLRPQVGALLINANRNLDTYARVGGCGVVPDRLGEFAGPLAGMASAMEMAQSSYLLTAPCDCPFVAGDLAQRLFTALRRQDGQISVAHDGERMQPVFALIECSLLPSLLDFLHSGKHKIDLWYAQHRLALADFSDSVDTFLNINTPQEREALETRLAQPS